MTLGQVKQYLGITGIDYDCQLQVILDGVLALFWNIIGYDLNLATDVEEYYNGGAEQHIFLDRYPIISLTTVQYNTGTNSTPVWTDFDVDSYIRQDDTGMITFTNSRVPRGRKNIKIVYTAGYDVLPSNIVYAILTTIETLRKRKGTGGISSESIDDYSVSFTNENIDPATRLVLDKYIRIDV